MLKEIRASYDGLIKENNELRERLKRLKAQHDKENGVYKHN